MPGIPDFLSVLSDEELLQLMLFACPDGVVATDREGMVVLYTGASEQIFGFPPIEVLNQGAAMLFGEHWENLLERIGNEGRVTGHEMVARRKDSPPFPASISAAGLSDRYGGVMGTVIYIRDHSDVRAIEDALRENNDRLNELVRELNYVARHDHLTGLLHRGSAMEAAEAVLLSSGLPGMSFGIAIFDIDHFKTVNDSYGHLVGDDVLAGVAQLLQRTARQGDIVGRFGGEEFIAFLPGADLSAVNGFAERVREAIAEETVVVGNEVAINVTISAGVAALPTCADSLQDGIRVADDRLYIAKRAGRNRVVASDEAVRRSAA
ncbi:MAG TPA: sensor domain-containing diguanylate cyclase [Tepidiformaceae bacterium]